MVRARREDPSFDVRKVVVSNVHPNAPVGTANQGQHCSNARSAPCCRLGLSSLDQFGVLPRPHIFGFVGVFIVRRNTPQYQVQHFFAMRQAVLVRLRYFW